jgi:hypothetical protein
MTELKKFLETPWKREVLHPTYQNSFLHMYPAPEYGTGEVLLASLYRNVGLNLGEGQVPKHGRAFSKNLQKRVRPDNNKSAINIDNTEWERLITRSLSSPKQPNQAKNRFLQINPIVPDAAIYSLSARLTGNPWNPGLLVANALCYGAENDDKALELWQEIFDHLSIDEDGDDIWARLLQAEFKTWRSKSLEGAWQRPDELPKKLGVHAGLLQVNHPAKQFAKDLITILNLKDRLTRRQWLTMLESVLRLGTASHTMWLCNVNSTCFDILDNVLKGNEPPSESSLIDKFSLQESFWGLGQKSHKTVMEKAEDFIVGRLGTNLILWYCDLSNEIDVPTNALSSPIAFANFARQIYEKRNQFPLKEYLDSYQKSLEKDPRIPACTSGISKNIVEFIEHTLRQRITLESGMESYDQGYYLKQVAKNYPWKVFLGPVSTIAMSFCCTSAIKGPRTVADLKTHLALYGFDISIQQDNDFVRLLRSLNLVLDSPDAEGGMILLNFFEKH